jgi:hypothetical protein
VTGDDGDHEQAANQRHGPDIQYPIVHPPSYACRDDLPSGFDAEFVKQIVQGRLLF